MSHILGSNIQFKVPTNFVFVCLYHFVLIGCAGSSGGTGASTASFNPSDTFSEASLNTTRWTPTALTGSGSIVFTGSALSFNSTGAADYTITTKYKATGNFTANADVSMANFNDSSNIMIKLLFKTDGTSEIRLRLQHLAGVGIRVTCYKVVSGNLTTESTADIGNSFPMNNIPIVFERNSSQVDIYVNGNLMGGLAESEYQTQNPSLRVQFITVTSGNVTMSINDWAITGSVIQL